MKKIIIPSIIARTQRELNRRIDKVDDYLKLIHLDIMDGKFVPNRSLDFNFHLPKGLKYEAHLMVNNPLDWMLENGYKVDRIIVHEESTERDELAIKLAKKLKKEIGFALRPETPLSKIKKYLDKIDMVLILDVNPGAYGGKIIPKTLVKISKLRKLKPKLNIEIDGGVNLNTAGKMSQSGANMFACGSYLQHSLNVKELVSKLLSEVESL